MQIYTISCSIAHLVIKEPVKSLKSPKRYPEFFFLCLAVESILCIQFQILENKEKSVRFLSGRILFVHSRLICKLGLEFELQIAV